MKEGVLEETEVREGVDPGYLRTVRIEGEAEGERERGATFHERCAIVTEACFDKGTHIGQRSFRIRREEKSQRAEGKEQGDCSTYRTSFRHRSR